MPASTFSITPMVELDSIGINVAVDDVQSSDQRHTTHERH
jgi:hypothetical protein